MFILRSIRWLVNYRLLNHSLNTDWSSRQIHRLLLNRRNRAIRQSTAAG